MKMPAGPFSIRAIAALSVLALTAACDEPLDFDMRGKVGAFSTASAAQQAVGARPQPDDRGVISYPNYQVVVARRGDTVSDVANRIGLPSSDLARYNGLTPGDPLREGEVIALPRRVAEPSAATGVDIASLAGSAIDASPDTTPSVSTATLPPASSSAAAASSPCVCAMMAAASFSAWRTRSAALRCGIRLGICSRIITGIIWKVDALPTPVAKNSSMALTLARPARRDPMAWLKPRQYLPDFMTREILELKLSTLDLDFFPIFVEGCFVLFFCFVLDKKHNKVIFTPKIWSRLTYSYE